MIRMRICFVLFAVLMSFVSINGNSSNTLPCSVHDSINITDGEHIGNNIVFHDINFGPDQYATVDYALDGKSNEINVSSHIRGCICNVKACIRTCCPDGFIRVNNKTATTDCVRNDDMKNSDFPIPMENGTFPAKNRFAIVHYKPPKCAELLRFNKYSISQTGEAMIGETKLNTSYYCINYVINATTKALKNNLLYCDAPFNPDHPDSHHTEFHDRTVPYLLLLSIPFLIATILVYRFIPELYTLHGKCLLWYLVSLIFAFGSTAIIKLNSSLSMGLCHASGWIMYLSYIAAFLWLSVICYDLWSTIRTTNGYQRYSDNRLFIYYFAYAVGLSVTLTIFAMIMDYGNLPPDSWRPLIGDNICFIKEKFARGLYFYGPMAIIFSINVVLFVSTVLKIRQFQRNSESESEMHKRNLKTNLKKCFLYLQLFVVMGIPWVMEVLVFFFETFHGKISRIFDVINALQGLIIFILLVLKPHTRRLIKKRWQQYKGVEVVNTISDPKETKPLSMTQVD